MFTASIDVANQVEEYCADMSTGEETDSILAHALKNPNQDIKRIRKKRKFFDDTEETDWNNNSSAEENSSKFCKYS